MYMMYFRGDEVHTIIIQVMSTNIIQAVTAPCGEHETNVRVCMNVKWLSGRNPNRETQS